MSCRYFGFMNILYRVVSVYSICSLNYKYERVNFCRICLLSFVGGVASKLLVPTCRNLQLFAHAASAANFAKRCFICCVTRPSGFVCLSVS